MATTVTSAFSQYATNLNITDRQTTVVSNCRANVVAKIGSKLTLHSEQPSKLIGSYDRDTLIRYLSEGDVDVMVILNYGQHKEWDNKEGATKVLERYRTILQEAYTDTPCRVDRNCVTMQLSQFRLDVVPAFHYTQGYYTIPDTYRGAWLKTDPIAYADQVTSVNKTMGGAFVPLVKMIKGWNRELPKPLRSFHLECMMLNRYRSYTQSYTYDSMVNAFFSDLPTYISKATYDPTTGDQVDLYLDNGSLGYSRADLVKRAENAAAKAQEAYDDREKYPSVAIKEWKELFGEFFPAYG